MINEVYLDIDDTLNRFSACSMKYVGCPIDPETYIGEPEFRGDYNLLERVNSYGTVYELGEFWDKFPRDFWATVPKSPEFHQIIRWAEALVEQPNVSIATAPTKDPDCLAGKLEWMYANLPSHYHRNYFVTPRKYKLSMPGRLLVDDADDNMTKWRAGGGYAILVPRPWNKLWSVFESGQASIMDCLRREFQIYFGMNGLDLPRD